MGLFSDTVSAVTAPLKDVRSSADGVATSVGGNLYTSGKEAAKTATNSDYAKLAGYTFTGANVASAPSLFSLQNNGGASNVSDLGSQAGNVGGSPALYSPKFREGAFQRALETAQSLGIPASILDPIANWLNNNLTQEGSTSNEYSSGEGGTYFSGTPAQQSTALVIIAGIAVAAYIALKK